MQAPQPHTLIDCIRKQCSQDPDKPAICWQGKTVSYGQLLQQVLTMASAFCNAVEPAGRIAVLGKNSPQYIALLYAVPAAARILVPLNTRLAPAELIYQLRQSGASLLIGDGDLLKKLHADPAFARELGPLLSIVETGETLDSWVEAKADASPAAIAPAKPGELAWLLYTSGTTGRPKGAMLSQSGLLAGLESGAQGRPVLPGDHYLYPFPLFHVAAHNVLLQHQHGACVVLLPAFEAKAVIHCCRELPITSMSLAPTMIAMLLDHPDFDYAYMANVRTIGYGASAISADLLRRLLNNTEVGLCQGYGMTELSGSIAFLDENAHREAWSNHPERLKSVGKPVAGVSIKLVPVGERDDPAQVGEIAVQARQTMLGYWQQREATEQALVDGWLHTGDIGRFDEQGYLYLVDRKKDMMISGGENVASREVEDVISLHPSVRKVAVVGVADPKWGEAITAFVQPEPEAQLSSDALKQHCRAHLAGYKMPKHVAFVETITSNASGKVDKKALKEEAALRFGQVLSPLSPDTESRLSPAQFNARQLNLNYVSYKLFSVVART